MLSPENPLRTETSNHAPVGAYTATMLSANFTSPAPKHQDTILDTGAAKISYFKDDSFLDPRSVHKFTEPVPTDSGGPARPPAPCRSDPGSTVRDPSSSPPSASAIRARAARRHTEGYSLTVRGVEASAPRGRDDKKKRELSPRRFVSSRNERAPRNVARAKG